MKTCLTSGSRWADLEVLALRDGDHVEPRETVMLITGPYAAFAHLETLYLGVLARRTRVATNTRLVVEAAWPKPVMFFPARFDHWLVQTGDGYAAAHCRRDWRLNRRAGVLVGIGRHRHRPSCTHCRVRR